MSADAIFDLTDALRNRIEQLVPPVSVHIGPPTAADVGDNSVALFLFHIEPNRELRNAQQFVGDGNGQADLRTKRDVLPLDLRYMVSVFRDPPDARDPVELNTLGRVMQALATEPTFGDAVLRDQTVRLTPEPYPMEEISRVWGLFPETRYRTSVVYLASPLFITPDALRPGSPVQERTVRSGVSTESPNLFGDRAAVEATNG